MGKKVPSSQGVSVFILPVNDIPGDVSSHSTIQSFSQVKKRQQRALLILDSLKVDYKAIDITEPGNEEERDRFREVCKKKDPEPIPYPPQFFNEDKYCGVSLVILILYVTHE